MVLKLIFKHEPVSRDSHGCASRRSVLPRLLKICATTLTSSGENKANYSLNFFSLEGNGILVFQKCVRCLLLFCYWEAIGEVYSVLWEIYMVLIYMYTHIYSLVYMYIRGYNSSLTPALHHCLPAVNLGHLWITLLWMQMELILQHESEMLFYDRISESFVSRCGFVWREGPRRSWLLIPATSMGIYVLLALYFLSLLSSPSTWAPGVHLHLCSLTQNWRNGGRGWCYRSVSMLEEIQLSPQSDMRMDLRVVYKIIIKRPANTE